MAPRRPTPLIFTTGEPDAPSTSGAPEDEPPGADAADEDATRAELSEPRRPRRPNLRPQRRCKSRAGDLRLARAELTVRCRSPMR